MDPGQVGYLFGVTQVYITETMLEMFIIEYKWLTYDFVHVS